MVKLLNHINTYQSEADYQNDKSKNFPNISYIQGSDEVKWNKYDPYPRVIAKYKFKVNSSKNCLLSDEQVILKLNRNFYCSNVISKENEHIINKQYGSLRITYNKETNEISSIWNEHYPIDLCVDELLRTKMNEIMELN